MLKQRYRKRLQSAPFPESWRQIIRTHFPLFNRLPQQDQRELEGHVQVFLAEKSFEGCGGLVMTEEIRSGAERERKSVLDSYGATDPAEFFAVATEAFFEKPLKLSASSGPRPSLPAITPTTRRRGERSRSSASASRTRSTTLRRTACTPAICSNRASAATRSIWPWMRRCSKRCRGWANPC